MNGISCSCDTVLNSPLEEITPKERIPVPGVQIVKSAELTGISDYKPLNLHLHS